ncbi:hypothetical protein ET532_028795 [Verminephrobacter sp. Larva24]|nr:hypothetical protein ET532_028795 [Verminephrobacter sp. Larva24]
MSAVLDNHGHAGDHAHDDGQHHGRAGRGSARSGRRLLRRRARAGEQARSWRFFGRLCWRLDRGQQGQQGLAKAWPCR